MGLPAEIDFKNTRGWPRTQQQYDLCQAMIVGGLSRRKAALAANYSLKTVDKKLASILGPLKPYLDHLRAKKSVIFADRWILTVDNVVEELTLMGLVNPKDYIRAVRLSGVPMLIGKPLDELTDDQAKAIVSWDRVEVQTDEGIAFDYQYKFYDKRQVLRDLGQHVGMFNEKLILEQRIIKTHKVDLSQVPDDILEEWMNKLESFSDKPKAIEHDPIT